MSKILPMIITAILQLFSLIKEQIAERGVKLRIAADSYARIQARVVAGKSAARAAVQAHRNSDGDNDLDQDFRRREDA